MSADNGPKFGADATLPQPGFDFVEVLDLQDDPPGVTRSLFGSLMELASDMRPATGKCDPAITALREGTVCLVSIALEGAIEVHWDDVI